MDSVVNLLECKCMNDQIPLLQMKGITKRFPGVVANDNVSFEVRRGEIHALLGENGAGKSTLMNILYGLQNPDNGEIVIDGEQVHISSPKVAVDAGVGMVHQHFMLVENMTAIENVMLGIHHAKQPILDLEGTREKFNQIVEKYGLVVDPDLPVWQLSVGEQQWLEIIKLLFRDVHLLILDEPTAVLTPAEAHQLFKTLSFLISEGRSIIFITHKLDEVQEIADRVTVLRDGKLVGTINKVEASLSVLSKMMVGRSVSLDRRSRPINTKKEPVLVVNNLQCRNERGLEALKSINLTMNSGEILGVAGVDGNGQRELAECITGLRHPSKGQIRILDSIVTDVVDDSSLLGFIPEDRHRTGLILDFTIYENLVMRTYKAPPFDWHSITNWAKVKSFAKDLIKTYDIRTPNELVSVNTLSGGNQQKVVVARETNGQPKVVIASQPTRGLDLGAIEALHELLLRERNRGAAVMFISTELSEVMALSDRIIVMFNGEIMGEIEGETADIFHIGEMMMGHRSKNN
jgi:general nucleoside transport system ATP-binding protein